MPHSQPKKRFTLTQPTAKQRAFANQLGVEVDHATKASLRRDLTHAVTDLRTEAAANRMNRSRLITEAIRVSGLRVGSIIERYNGLFAVAHIFVDAPSSVAGVEDGKYDQVDLAGCNGTTAYVSAKVVYNPPPGYLPRCLSKPQRGNEPPGDYRKRSLAFWDFAESRVTNAERFTNPYGAFWSVTAVERCQSEFAAEEVRVSDERARREAETQKQRLEKHMAFCSVCGERKRKSTKFGRCYDCADRPLEPTRFCSACGTQFTVESGVHGSANFLCPNDRKKK